MEDNILTKFVKMMVGQIPLLILIPSNLAIIIQVIRHSRQSKQLQQAEQNEATKARGVTIMVLSITVSFIILQLPFSIWSTCCDHFGPEYRIVGNVMTLFPVINCSLNFYLYFLSSVSFRNQVSIEFSKMFACCVPSLRNNTQRQPSVATITSRASTSVH